MARQLVRHMVLLAGSLLAACAPGQVTPSEPVAYAPELPTHFPQELPAPERNPTTEEGVLLGRRLFYDPMLSANGTVSCAMCHQVPLAFTDGVALSTAGVSGKPLLRHSPALINLAWADGLFWDGGAKDLESLMFAPITHPDEMAKDLKELVAEMQAHPEYPGLFAKAFPGEELGTAFVARALAQFVRTMVSGQSAYDRYLLGDSTALTGLQRQGLGLFQQHCQGCHSGVMLTDFGYHNNGLDSVYATAHESLAWGRGRITRNAEDIGKYKTPTLRQVALTAPYMHDGRFASLEAVLDHYAGGMVPSPSLDARFRQEGRPLGLPLGQEEKQALLAFLNSLTDEAFLTNPSFTEQ